MSSLQDRLESGLVDGDKLLAQIVDLYAYLSSEHWSDAVRQHALSALATFVTKVIEEGKQNKQITVQFGAYLMVRAQCRPMCGTLAKVLLQQLSCR